MTRNHRVNISLDKSVYQLLRKLAFDNGVQPGTMAKKLVEEGVKK